MRQQHIRLFVLMGIMLLGIDIAAAAAVSTVTQQVKTDTPALDAYENGFAWDTMRTPDGGGVMLNDMVLIENDGPGSGHSQKGEFIEYIHQGTLARKALHLEKAAASRAHVVLLMAPRKRPRSAQAPYYIIVNGHRVAGQPIAAHEGTWHWVPVESAFLKKGANAIIVGSDAPRGEGYALYMARRDEYEKGGGFYTYQGNTALLSGGQLQPPKGGGPGFQKIEVGQTSAKSTDGGTTWIQGKLGPKNDVVGEYTIRLNLQQHKPRGALRSAPLDLWDGLDNFALIKPRCKVTNLQLTGSGETPANTRIRWSVRFADTPDMTSDQWDQFKILGTGAKAAYSINEPVGRYMQWQAELFTDDPVATPVLKKVTIERALNYRPLREKAFFVRDHENVRHRYRSFRFTYEKHDHPKLKQLGQRLQLDESVREAVGDFEKINRVRHHVAQLWPHTLPDKNYPEWDAHDILDRKTQFGSGGMCTQYAVVFMQALQALGYQSQYYNIAAHESTEVWVDELGRWVHIDSWEPSDSYEYNTQTGEPLNILQQHQHYLNRYGFSADQPIDWMIAKRFISSGENNAQPLYSSTFTPECNNPGQLPAQHRLIPFARILPRNDFLSRPFPRPLNQGLVIHWPWNGYLNWYDAATPRKLQYALHSDRQADFHPTLNRVEFTATHAKKEGDIKIQMITMTPNFAAFEVNIDQQGWQTSADRFTWELRPSAINRLQLRTRNKNGVTGRESHIQVLWNYAAPFKD